MAEAKLEIEWLKMQRAVRGYLEARRDYFVALRKQPSAAKAFLSDMSRCRNNAAAAALSIARIRMGDENKEHTAAKAEILWDKFNLLLVRLNTLKNLKDKALLEQGKAAVNKAAADVWAFLELMKNEASGSKV